MNNDLIILGCFCGGTFLEMNWMGLQLGKGSFKIDAGVAFFAIKLNF